MHGVQAWNHWRHENPSDPVDLRGASLVSTNLSYLNLRGADVRGADLSGAYLAHANLRGTNLGHANLTNADLSGADFNGANLQGADLSYATIVGAELWHANLGYANLSNTDLNGANLIGASLIGANLIGTNLTGANLSATDLMLANFHHAVVAGVDFRESRCKGTIFANVDLSGAVGLDGVNHHGPSTIGLDTIHASNGNVTERFLRGAGVPLAVIEPMLPPVRTRAGQWHSCFISYSLADEEFARRLQGHLRDAGVRAWCVPEDIDGAKMPHEQLFKVIQQRDKLLLVLSRASVNSEWVAAETKRVREAEKKEQRRKLFPIRVVDWNTFSGWMTAHGATGSDLGIARTEENVPDFTGWRDQPLFDKAFEMLKQELSGVPAAAETAK